METNISALQEGLQNKEEPMAYAHSRINQRRQRPNVELVHDPPQKRLIQEVGEITGQCHCQHLGCVEMIVVKSSNLWKMEDFRIQSQS